MSFMYQSMMTRAPGKRKIKLQEENIVRMLQDEDDEEEDEDFKIGSDKLSEIESDDSSKELSESSSSSKDESSDEDKNKSQKLQLASNQLKSLSSKSRRNRHHKYIAPTIKSTTQYITSQYHDCPSNIKEILVKATKQFEISTATVSRTMNITNVKVCCICLNAKKPETIISCCRCGITVHKDCYQWIKHKRKRNKDSWFCDLCISGKQANCELCPSKEGCIKETSNGQWCHVVCARYILKRQIYSTKGLNIVIDFTNLDYRLYNKKECFLCQDRLFSKTGISVKCDAGLCKTYFHVTCAQKHGLLADNETELNSETDPYFVYCPLHLEKEKMLKSQKTYISLFAAMKYKQENNKDHFDKEELQKLNINYIKHKPSNSNHHSTSEPRLLTSNAHALKLLNEKAERMFGINVRSPSCYFPRPLEVRKRHRITPSLTPQFTSHYMDLNIRINEIKRRIDKAVEENKSLLKKQEELRVVYNKSQDSLTNSQVKRNQIFSTSQNLFTFITRLKQWSQENVQNRLEKRSFNKMRLPLYNKPPEIFVKSPKQRKRSAQSNKVTSPAAKQSKPTEINSILNQCYICKSDGEQHLLVDCDLCKKWIHLKCLDPPLTQMPKKTKFSMWQCSECALSCSEDNSDTNDITHGSLITAEGRRHTQRSHKPPNKLATMLFDDNQIAEQRKMINLISSKFRKTHKERRKKLNDKKRRRKQNLKNVKKERSVEQANNKIKKPFSTQSLNLISKTPVQNIAEKFNLTEARVMIDRNSAKNHFTIPSDKTLNCNVQARKLQTTTNILAALGKLVKTNKTITIIPKKASVDNSNITTSNFNSENRDLYQNENKNISVENQLEKVNTPIEGKSTLNNHTNESKNIKSFEERINQLNGSLQGVKKSKKSPAKVSVPTPTNNLINFSVKVKVNKPSTTTTNNKITENNEIIKEIDTKISENVKINEEGKDNTQNDSAIINTNADKAITKVENKEKLIPSCKECNKTEEQNKMLLCDKCKFYYHIWCCDPPLEQVPKKYKGTFWECSNCVPNSEKEDEDEIKKSPQMEGLKLSPDGSKRTTRRRKPPEKFSSDLYSASQIYQNVMSKRKKQRIKKQKARKLKGTKNYQTLTSTQNSNQQSRHLISFLQHVKPVSIVKPNQPPLQIKENQHLLNTNTKLNPINFHDMHNYVKQSPVENIDKNPIQGNGILNVSSTVKPMLPRLNVNVLQGTTSNNSSEIQSPLKIESKQLAKGVNFYPILSGQQLKFVCNSVNPENGAPIFNSTSGTAQLPQNAILISTKPLQLDPNLSPNNIKDMGSLDLSNMNFVSCIPAKVQQEATPVPNNKKQPSKVSLNTSEKTELPATSSSIVNLMKQTKNLSKLVKASIFVPPCSENNVTKSKTTQNTDVNSENTKSLSNS